MRKPVEALRVVSNEFLHETRAPLRRRWQPRLFSRRFNSPSRFSRASSWESEVAFLRAGHSSRSGVSNPFRIGKYDEDIQVNVKERESKILTFPLAPVDCLECDSSSVREQAVSLPDERKGDQQQCKTPVCVA